jgi:hypothetical protein
MLALSDTQLALVMTAAGGLPVEKRSLFLRRALPVSRDEAGAEAEGVIGRDDRSEFAGQRTPIGGAKSRLAGVTCPEFYSQFGTSKPEHPAIDSR